MFFYLSLPAPPPLPVYLSPCFPCSNEFFDIVHGLTHRAAAHWHQCHFLLLEQLLRGRHRRPSCGDHLGQRRQCYCHLRRLQAYGIDRPRAANALERWRHADLNGGGNHDAAGLHPEHRGRVRGDDLCLKSMRHSWNSFGIQKCVRSSSRREEWDLAIYL